jgi:signal transduction histidine kinase
MPEESNNPTILNSRELEAIFAISRLVSHATDTEAILDEVIALARPVFVFDNVVLYQQQASDNLEPFYARAIGRGRSEEADLAWGEATAAQIVQSGEVVIRQEINESIGNDRMRRRYFLGLPMAISGHPIGALVFVRYGGPEFISEQVRLAEYIADQIAQLLEHEQLVKRLVNLEAERQVERLQDDFVATISHELRTPLGFIKGYATTLMREDTTWDEDTRREFLTVIDEEADRLRELIDNLLDSSRLQSGTLHIEFQPVRLDTMVKDMALRARSFHEHLPVEVNINTPRLLVQADPTRMAQVFDNLLSNAVKYAPGSKVVISLTADENMAHVTVRDFGPGIAPNHLEHIFTRFYRVPGQASAVHGTGLGLFICRRIIRAHGGDITAESTPGEGTAFHIYLPCHTSDNEDTLKNRGDEA